jgi:hypothetical protein
VSNDAPYVIIQIEQHGLVGAPVVGRLAYRAGQAIVEFLPDKSGSLPESAPLFDESLRLWRNFAPGRPAVYLYDEVLSPPLAMADLDKARIRLKGA